MDNMAWLNDCAMAVTSTGKAFVWTTPVGSKITQGYVETTGRRVMSSLGNLNIKDVIKNEDGSSVYNVEKSGSSASPNVIHSYDAAHLVMWTNVMNVRGLDGMVTIHDSFGTYAADTTVSMAVLRETMVEMYSVNPHERMANDVEAITGERPTVPVTGSFDINEILTSPYVFY